MSNVDSALGAGAIRYNNNAGKSVTGSARLNAAPATETGFTSIFAGALASERAAIFEDYPEHVESPVTGSTKETSATDYSALISNAFKDQVTQMSITAGAGMSGADGGYSMQHSSQGIENLILAATASGRTSDAQTALFMLCMMMQTNQDGEYSMLMQMMISMISQMQSESAALRDSAMNSDYDPYVLDTIDSEVFGNQISSIFVAGETIIPVEAWRPTTPAITSNETNRSPERYRAVIDQFNVETAERYRPGRNDSTYCNIFLWDVTKAMGAEIPHYTDPETGEPRYYPDTKGAKSMGAIATDAWLEKHGREYGWYEADAETAQRYANEGKPAVTSAGSLGHVQIVCPSEDGGFDTARGVTIAQAGRIVTNYSYISGTYSTTGQKNVRYWIHD